MKELKDIVTGTVTWQVTVSDEGRFYANADGFNQLTAESYADLENVCKVRASQSRTKVDVPFTYFSNVATGRPQVVHMTATGIHSSNGNILTRDSHGKPGQQDNYGSSRYKPLAEADEARVLGIMREQHRLEAEKTEILSRYVFKSGLNHAVREAIDQAAAAALRAKEAGSE